MKIICKSCGTTTQIKNTNNVGEMVKESRYYPIFSMNGELCWYCHKCWVEIYSLALNLKEKLNADYIGVDHILFERHKPRDKE